MRPSSIIFAFFLGGIVVALIARNGLLAVGLGVCLAFLVLVKLLSVMFPRPGSRRG